MRPVGWAWLDWDVTPHTPRGVPITGDARTQLAAQYAKRYAAGESIRSLAATSGRSYGFVQTLLREAGVNARPRGGPTRGPKAAAARARTAERIAEVRATLEAEQQSAPKRRGRKRTENQHEKDRDT